MKQIIYFIFILFFISNCSLNKVIKHHGVAFLDKKQEKLEIKKTNKNDIISLLGPPSTTSTFDDNLWIYIERKTSSSKLTKLGKKKILVNNILVLEIANTGLLSNKFFLTKEDMNKIDFDESFTEMTLLQRSFLYNFLSSLRQKMNDPLGNKRSK